jgi:hypothetical protein
MFLRSVFFDSPRTPISRQDNGIRKTHTIHTTHTRVTRRKNIAAYLASPIPARTWPRGALPAWVASVLPPASQRAFLGQRARNVGQ